MEGDHPVTSLPPEADLTWSLTASSLDREPRSGADVISAVSSADGSVFDSLLRGAGEDWGAASEGEEVKRMEKAEKEEERVRDGRTRTKRRRR